MQTNTLRPIGSAFGCAHSLRMVFSRLAGIRPLGATRGLAAPRIPGLAWALVAALGTIMAGATTRGQGHARPDSLGVLAGSDAQLRDNIDQDSIGGGCIKFGLVPVNPYPGGGSYPAGTTLGPNSITLPGCGAQCVWLETRISNWACSGGTMGTWVARIGPESVLPAGIEKCDRACASAANCTAAGFGPGTGADCGTYEPGLCNQAFMQQAAQQPTAMNFDIEACNATNLECGGTQTVNPGLVDTGSVRYGSTAVVNVTAGFSGSATINFQNPNVDTLFQDGNQTQIPIGQLVGATITVPAAGSCCFGLGTPGEGCLDDVTECECNTQPAPRVFHPNQPCPPGGAPCTNDCNANMIPDHCDIDCALPGCNVPGCTAPGCNNPGCRQSEDCDNDGIPDECCPDGIGIAMSDGTDDNFVVPEPSSPRPELQAFLTCPLGTQGFDEAINDRCFGHTFENLPTKLLGAILILRVRAQGGGASNDALSLGIKPGCTPTLAWSHFIGDQGAAPGLVPGVWSGGRVETITLDLEALPNAVGPPTNLLNLIKSEGALDIRIQDDTNVDLVELLMEVCPSDCNDNDIRDVCDIASGHSQDCNGNGIPDECECAPPFADSIVAGDSGSVQLAGPYRQLHRWLYLKQTRYDDPGDLTGGGEHVFVYRSRPVFDQASGMTQVDWTNFGKWPKTFPYKQRRSKSNSTCQDTAGVCDSDSDCRWHEFQTGLRRQGPLLYEEPDSKGTAAQDFGQLCPVQLQMQFYDVDVPWLAWLYFLVSLLFVVGICIATIPSGPAGCLIAIGLFEAFLIYLGPALPPQRTRVASLDQNVDINTIQPPTTPFFECQEFTLSNTLSGTARIQLDWKLWATGPANLTPTPCNFTCCYPLQTAASGPTADTDLNHFSYGQESATELSFFANVEGDILRDASTLPASPPRTREIRFAVDADGDDTTGGPAPLCGAECYVAVTEEYEQGAPVPGGPCPIGPPCAPTWDMRISTSVWCWKCPCPGAPPTWVQNLNAVAPYDLFVGQRAARVTARMQDIGNPVCGMSAWAVLYEGGVPLSMQPGDPCNNRLPIAIERDTLCPWVEDVEFIDTTGATPGVFARPIVVTFNEAMAPIDPSDPSDITIVPSVPLTGGLDASAPRVLFIYANTPGNVFPPGRYVMTISGSVTDVDIVQGNPLNGDEVGTCGDPFVFGFCVPDEQFFSTNSAGTPKDHFAGGEPIYVRGTGMSPGSHLLYLVESEGVEDPGGLLVDRSDNGPTGYTIVSGSTLPVTGIGIAVTDGEYCVVADLNNNGRFDLTDRVVGLCEMGLSVGNPCDSSLPGKVAWWDLDEVMPGGPVAELMDSNHGEVFGAGSTPLFGVVGLGRYFDGASYVGVADDDDLDINPAEFSIDAWVWVDSTKGNGGGIIGKGVGMSGQGYDLIVNLDQGVYRPALLLEDGFISIQVPSTLAIPPDEWVHLAVTAAVQGDGGPLHVRFYVNGPPADGPYSVATAGTFDNTDDLRIGNSAVAGFHEGILDEVQLFDRAITDAEVDFIYRRGGAGKCLPAVPQPPNFGDDTCQTSGADLNTPCSTSADCTVTGSACGLKSRYLSIRPGTAAVAGETPTSIQVEIVSMKQCAGGINAGRGCTLNSHCPGSTCVNSPNIGDIWWARPEVNIPNSPNTGLRGAPLQCTTTPNSQVWTSGVLHLWGQAVVPGSTYNVRMCDASGSNCSTPLLVATAKWGDVIRAFGGGSQPNFGDVSAIVAKFGNVASAPNTARTDIVGPQAPGTPNTPNQGTNFADVSNDVSAFSGFAYPYTVSACP